MSKKSLVKKLTDLMVDSNLQQLITGEREILAEIIIYIREVDGRRMYLAFGYPSLFEYLTKRMGYSNASAQRRINTARLSSDVPIIMGLLESGEINLSQISVMAQAIRQVNKTSDQVSTATKEQLISELVGKDLIQTEVIVSAALNIPLKESTKAKHQKDKSVRFEVTLTKEQWAKLNQARDLLSSLLPSGSWDQVIEKMSEQVIVKKDKSTSNRARAARVNTSGVKNLNLVARIDVSRDTLPDACPDVRSEAHSDIALEPRRNEKARSAIPKLSNERFLRGMSAANTKAKSPAINVVQPGIYILIISNPCGLAEATRLRI